MVVKVRLLGDVGREGQEGKGRGVGLVFEESWTRMRVMNVGVRRDGCSVAGTHPCHEHDNRWYVYCSLYKQPDPASM